MVSTAEAPDFYQSRLGRQLLELLLVRYVTITHDMYSSVPVCSHVLYEMNLGVHSPMTKQIIAYLYFALRNDGLGHHFKCIHDRHCHIVSKNWNLSSEERF